MSQSAVRPPDRDEQHGVRVELYDTTLRDGTQGLGFNLSLEDKLCILAKLDSLGFDYVEGGYPLSNPKDAVFFERARALPLDRTRLTAFGMTRRKGQDADHDAGMAALLRAATPAVAIVGKTWDFHTREVLHVSLEENISMIADSVNYFHRRGKEVIYDAEHFFDGYKGNPPYAMRTVLAALEAGADLVCLCDTNGGSLPREVGSIVAEVRATLGAVRVGIHTHNDAGVALANALEAVEQGAVQVQGTINGVGERCGNVDLIAVAATLELKLKRPVLDGHRSLEQLTSLSHFVDDVAHRPRSACQPYVGASAFAHKGGMHAHAVQRNVATYEHVAPQRVGNERRILISELSGVSNVRARVAKILGAREISRKTLQQIVDAVTRHEAMGGVYEDADASFELLVRRVVNAETPRFVVEHYRCDLSRSKAGRPVATAAATAVIGDVVERSVAHGDDPLSVLERAVREALQPGLPSLAEVRTVDRRFRAVERLVTRGTRVRASIDFTDGDHCWTTMAVGPNIVDAFVESLSDGLEYFLVARPGSTACAPADEAGVTGSVATTG